MLKIFDLHPQQFQTCPDNSPAAQAPPLAWSDKEIFEPPMPQASLAHNRKKALWKRINASTELIHIRESFKKGDLTLYTAFLYDAAQKLEALYADGAASASRVAPNSKAVRFHNQLLQACTVTCVFSAAVDLDTKLLCLHQAEASGVRYSSLVVLGETALHHLCNTPTTGPTLSALTGFLLARGADAATRNWSGSTAAHLLGRQANPLDALQLLLQAGISPNAQDGWGYSIMHRLVVHPTLARELLKKCLEFGGRLDIETPRRETLLHMLLASRDDRDLVAWLVLQGTPWRQRDLAGFTDLDYAYMLNRRFSSVHLAALRAPRP